MDDKASMYKFYLDNKGNLNLYKNMIIDFIELMNFLNYKRKEDNNKEKDIIEETKIYDLAIKLKENLSNLFIKFFEYNKSLTIDKTSEILDYYLKLIFEEVKDEIKKYQVELDNELITNINNYFQKEHFISKKDFSQAIRLFITLVLFLEKDKEKKIKSNRLNLVD